MMVGGSSGQSAGSAGSWPVPPRSGQASLHAGRSHNTQTHTNKCTHHFTTTTNGTETWKMIQKYELQSMHSSTSQQQSRTHVYIRGYKSLHATQTATIRLCLPSNTIFQHMRSCGCLRKTHVDLTQTMLGHHKIQQHHNKHT